MIGKKGLDIKDAVEIGTVGGEDFKVSAQNFNLDMKREKVKGLWGGAIPECMK